VNVERYFDLIVHTHSVNPNCSTLLQTQLNHYIIWLESTEVRSLSIPLLLQLDYEHRSRWTDESKGNIAIASRMWGTVYPEIYIRYCNTDHEYQTIVNYTK
jgi:hypothetical protein